MIDVEKMLTLSRLEQSPDAVVANLAKTTLSLVEMLREAQVGWEYAEAALESERARIKAVRGCLGDPERSLDCAAVVKDIRRLLHDW